MLTTCSKHPVSLVTLEVRTSNQTAQNLYHKYQFEMVGQRRRYYRDTGEDALIMTLATLDAPYYQFLNQQQKNLLTRLPTISLP
jgi:ribosomal-protein-alanine N-acetyltransferase